jgi:hypothetical protein
LLIAFSGVRDRLTAPEYQVRDRRLASGRPDQHRDLAPMIRGVAEQLGQDVLDAIAEPAGVQALVLELTAQVRVVGAGEESDHRSCASLQAEEGQSLVQNPAHDMTVVCSLESDMAPIFERLGLDQRVLESTVAKLFDPRQRISNHLGRRAPHNDRAEAPAGKNNPGRRSFAARQWVA